MKHSTRLALWCGAAATFAGLAHAQSNSGDDQVVHLSEFSVSADAPDSYLASETTTGSRVAVKIKDLPYNVDVITREFLDDFAFFELSDEFAYTSSFGQMDAGGGFNIRGLGATKSLRDGFQRFGLLDKVSIDRIEIIKGPSAAIYGETRPGGLINVISKHPRTHPSYYIRGSGGSYDTWRVEGGATGPVPGAKGLYYNFDAADYERQYDQPFAYQHLKTGAGSLEKKFSDGTDLYVSAEWLDRKNNGQASVPLADYGSAAASPTGQRYRIAYELKGLPVTGPLNYTNRQIAQYVAELEHPINSVWSTRAAASYFHRHYWTFSSGGISKYNPLTGDITRGEPGGGKIDEDGGGAQADVLAHYWLFNHTTENRTLFTLDYNTYWRVDPQLRLMANGKDKNNPVPHSSDWLVANNLWVRNVTPDLLDFRVPAPGLENYPRINRYRHNRVDTWGTFLRHQTAIKKRLIIAASLRYDTVKYRLSDHKASAQAGNPSLVKTEAYDIHATTPSAGFNFKLRPNIALYGNYSKSFFPDSQNVQVGSRKPPEGGYGYDYGVKVTSPDNLYSFTLGGFYIERTNVQVNVFDDATGEIVPQFVGGQRVRGLEFDSNFNLRNGVTVLAGYGYTDSRNVHQGVDVDAEGRRSPRVPNQNAYLALRYNFQAERLKGLRFTLGARYTGNSYPFSLDGGIKGPDGIIRTNDGRREIRLPGYTVVDLGLSYSWKFNEASRFTQSASINVKNATNEQYLSPGRGIGDSRGYYISYGVRF